jgi:hypothetical protein
MEAAMKIGNRKYCEERNDWETRVFLSREEQKKGENLQRERERVSGCVSGVKEKLH